MQAELGARLLCDGTGRVDASTVREMLNTAGCSANFKIAEVQKKTCISISIFTVFKYIFRINVSIILCTTQPLCFFFKNMLVF